jgi:hypothetical protein
MRSGARVFVDTRPGATKEAGDIVIPLRRGILTRKAIRGDLFELLPRQGQEPHIEQADHPVHVGRLRGRGFGGRDPGVEAGTGGRENVIIFNYL